MAVDSIFKGATMQDGVKTSCLESYEEFQALRHSWDAFMEKWHPWSYSRSHAWLSSWWKAYNLRCPVFLYIRTDSAGEISAAAPLRRRPVVLGGFPVRVIETLGAGLGSDDFLLSPNASCFVEDVFADLLRRRRWHIMSLKRINKGTGSELLRQVCDKYHCPLIVGESAEFHIDFPDNYDAYFQSRSANFRSKMNQAVRRLENRGTVSMETLNPCQQYEKTLSLGLQVARAGWQYAGGTSHFNDHGCGSFYSQLFKSGTGMNGEQFHILSVSGKPVAYLFGCRRGSTFHLVDTAYNADYGDFKAGHVLFGKVIKHLIDNGIARFDLEGDGAYKSHYSNGSEKSLFYEIYNRSLYPLGIKYLRSSMAYTSIKDRLKIWKQCIGQC